VVQQWINMCRTTANDKSFFLATTRIRRESCDQLSGDRISMGESIVIVKQLLVADNETTLDLSSASRIQGNLTRSPA
jgi:hypothetical protein